MIKILVISPTTILCHTLISLLSTASNRSHLFTPSFTLHSLLPSLILFHSVIKQIILLHTPLFPHFPAMHFFCTPLHTTLFFQSRDGFPDIIFNSRPCSLLQCWFYLYASLTLFLTRHSACVDEVVMFRSTAFTSALSYFRFEGFEEPAKLINKINKNISIIQLKSRFKCNSVWILRPLSQ